MLWRCTIVGLIGVATSHAAADQAHVTILFHVRPPYAHYGPDQQVDGLLSAPVSAALAKAGMTADWVETPPARQTEEIKRAKDATCGLGWFKRPERETFASFTDPIYRDRPTVIVARKDDARFTDSMSLQDSFKDPARTLVVKTGYSYGAAIDAWIRTLQPRAEMSSVTNELLLGMIVQGRADYAMMAPEEAEDLLASRPELGAALRPVTLGDAPDGEFRYLMCSHATPSALITRINDALSR
jgi:polar amino acid transport system substrate-binding protein